VDTSTKTTCGRGGMESKLHAVNKVAPLGIKAIISSKDNNRIVLDALTAEVGTYFGPKSSYDPELRKAWLISTKKLNCHIEVDKGAYASLLKGKSLFPKGIVGASGEFYKGDCVDLYYEGEPFAVGVSEYDMTDVDRIKRKHSDEIEEILGFKTGAEVVQTINLVLNEDKRNERERVS